MKSRKSAISSSSTSGNYLKLGTDGLVREVREPEIMAARVTADELIVELMDGRTISTPVLFYPRLACATVRERNNFQLIGRGDGIHWPDLDEDLSARGIVDGCMSGESQESLSQWLKNRTMTEKRKLHPASATQNKRQAHRKAS